MIGAGAPNGVSLGQRFEDLFLPYLDAAYSLARFLARDPVAADDIVQESFLRAFRSFGSYRGGDAKSWLLAIVRNCSFDWSKSNRRAAGITGPAGGSATGNIEPNDSRNDGDAPTPARNLSASAGDPFGESLGRWIPNPDELGDCSQDGPE